MSTDYSSERVRKMASFDDAQRKEVAELERRVKTSKRQPAVPKTAPKKNKSRKREEDMRAGRRVEVERAAERWKDPM